MTDRFYIQRLKQMVHKYGEELCDHCPLQKGFRRDTYFIKQNVNYSGCTICRELANIKDSLDPIPPCPCPAMRGRDQNPYKEALKIITKWEKEND